MKRFAVIGSICASFLLCGALNAWAQDEHRDDAREEHHEAKQEEHHEQEQQRHDEHQEARHDEHAARRIDEAHFRQHFGRDHHFVIHHVTMVEGRPRFSYGGYNFVIAQAWPLGWSYDDQCYIDYIDGEYFLFDLNHPGIRIAVDIL